MAGKRFEWALGHLRLGYRVRRAEWKPDARVRMDSEEGPPILRLEIAGSRHGIDWTPNRYDLHALDWVLAAEDE